MRYRLYIVQQDEWGDEEERTIREGSNREQMEILFEVWKDWAGPRAIRLLLETNDGDILQQEHFGGISYYDE